MRVSIPIDVRTARLQKLVRAMTLVEDLPPSTTRRLNDLARAQRLLAEAGEFGLAWETVAMLDAYLADSEGMDGWHSSIKRHIEAAKEVLH